MIIKQIEETADEFTYILIGGIIIKNGSGMKGKTYCSSKKLALHSKRTLFASNNNI